MKAQMINEKIVRVEETATDVEYIFEKEEYQIRYMHGGSVLAYDTCCISEQEAREISERVMGKCGITSASSLTVEIVKIISEYGALKSGRTNSYGMPLYISTEYYRQISEEVIWTSKDIREGDNCG